jgi:hypothetical protein
MVSPTTLSRKPLTTLTEATKAAITVSQAKSYTIDVWEGGKPVAYACRGEIFQLD